MVWEEHTKESTPTETVTKFSIFFYCRSLRSAQQHEFAQFMRQKQDIPSLITLSSPQKEFEKILLLPAGFNSVNEKAKAVGYAPFIDNDIRPFNVNEQFRFFIQSTHAPKSEQR